MVDELRFAVIGSPVMHSKSPNMHAAAYAVLGLPHVYEKIETRPDEVEQRVQALREGVFAGLNVTVPHKTNVLAFVDALDSSAGATGAANTLVRMPHGGVRAHNTDAPALAEEVVRLANGDGDAFKGKSAIVLGTGGAARAALFALASLGVAHVTVRGRKTKPELAEVLEAAGSSATIEHQLLTAPTRERDDLGVIIQATTAGMEGANTPGDVVADAIAWNSLHYTCVVYDVVYAPPKTPLIHRAEAHALSCDSGLGMLARQGALAFELWLGIKAPLEVMRSAL